MTHERELWITQNNLPKPDYSAPLTEGTGSSSTHMAITITFSVFK